MSKHIIRLIRPHQWLKNSFVFTPLFFSRHATEWCYVWPCVLAFLAFCFTASGVYCFNDIYDAEADRMHPVKRMRPVASGRVSTSTAYVMMGMAWLIAFALVVLGSFFSGRPEKGLAATLLFYMVINIAYSIKLKQIALLDVFIIAIGFVLRIVAGGLATGIGLSHWIVLITFLLALFLALAKRRDDVAVFEASGVKARKNVERYNMAFLGSSIAILGSITIMCYILYTVSVDVTERTGSHYLYVTSVFVLAGILRYMQLTLVDQKSGSPTNVLLHDHFIHACIIGWIVLFIFILYV
jgi:4-hydroxybenzoate polyprenyltransferase